jgi:hypothetical protein
VKRNDQLISSNLVTMGLEKYNPPRSQPADRSAQTNNGQSNPSQPSHGTNNPQQADTSRGSSKVMAKTVARTASGMVLKAATQEALDIAMQSLASDSGFN